GEEYVDKSYVSTSVSAATASHFAFDLSADKTARAAILVIYFDQPGEKGILIDKKESEILLRHGAVFKVMARRPIDDNADSYLVQMCSAACSPAASPEVLDFWQRHAISKP
ncbi:MAG: hypothetical protein PHP45_09975, partial [Elusimicrobiales bacterium]|nr:hypothetical protein [Elusimicrobiales bacterium]